MIKTIVQYIYDTKNIDFLGYNKTVINKQIEARMTKKSIRNINEYYNYLIKTEEEQKKLINHILINYSCFFNKPLTYELINRVILPEIISKKEQYNENSIRIWSVACSTGQEPYSLAIILNETIKANNNFNIFATDISVKSLKSAKIGKYTFDDVKDVKYGLLKKYFIKTNASFKITPKLQNCINFSRFDLLDTKNYVPPASIYGGFDIVMCSNVLIYYNSAYKNIILNKLYRALSPNGYLILGNSDDLTPTYKVLFKRINNISRIYTKI